MEQNMNQNMNQPLYNQMAQPPKKKFNYIMGFGIVVAISALVFFIMTIISSVLKSKGVDYAPLANFFSAMTIMASMGVLFIGSIIVIVISLTKK